MQSRSLWFVLALLMLAACAAPIAGTTPTPEPEPTMAILPSPTVDWFPSTPTPTRLATEVGTIPTQIAGVPVSWPILVADDFSDQTHWQVTSSAIGTAAYETNSLSLALPAGKTPLVNISDHILPGEFYLELTFDALMCSGADQYGLILWRNSTSGTFRIWFNCQGEVMADRQLNASTGRLLNWQTARKLQPGAPASNRIAVWAEDGQLRVFCEWCRAVQFADPQRSGGALGLCAGFWQQRGDFSISNLVIYAP